MKTGKPSSALHVYLIKPSKYDDDGFVIRHWRGVVPSNSLACLHGLTEDVRERGLLGEVEIRTHVIDESVRRIPLAGIARWNRTEGCRALACLVGVQTNQFCRAADIAVSLRREGVPVMLGGFHVSGMLAMFPGVSPEIQELLDAGVTIVAGEVEHRWHELLRDAWQGALQPIYRLIDDPPDLYEAACPQASREATRRFVNANYVTIDCSRGCPFHCSFCTVINVQGRRTRYRSPECVTGAIRRAYRESGIRDYFFTDDNFARNPASGRILDTLIAMRREEGIAVGFMMQVDVPAYRIPGFVEKASQAGCFGVFIGMESLNPRNLADAGKVQNHTEEYGAAIRAWRNARVRTQVGYIIGLPHDTEESVAEDVDRLIREVQPDQASFFMMIPLPGSADHKRLMERGVAIDPDYNKYDSCHETMPHARMSGEEWMRTFRAAWRRFYSLENMKAILERVDPAIYWGVLRNFFWCKYAVAAEGAHPMLTGFFRLKDRTTRRPGFEREGRLAHLRRRIPEVLRLLRSSGRLLVEMEELWLATRRVGETETLVLGELARIESGMCRRLRISELRAAYLRAKAQMPSIKVPSRLRLLWEQVALFRASPLCDSRRDLTRFWIQMRWRLRHGRIEGLLRLDRIALNAYRELRLASGFLRALVTEADYPGLTSEE
jgi:radical SAM superfamily enzyme YgiQ (UPF0313 family)